MGVYIEHMKLPEHCRECRFSAREMPNLYCSFDGILIKQGVIRYDQARIGVKKPEWCPLVEVEHGKA